MEISQILIPKIIHNFISVSVCIILFFPLSIWIFMGCPGFNINLIKIWFYMLNRKSCVLSHVFLTIFLLKKILMKIFQKILMKSFQFFTQKTCLSFFLSFFSTSSFLHSFLHSYIPLHLPLSHPVFFFPSLPLFLHLSPFTFSLPLYFSSHSSSLIISLKVNGNIRKIDIYTSTYTKWKQYCEWLSRYEPIILSKNSM